MQTIIINPPSGAGGPPVTADSLTVKAPMPLRVIGASFNPSAAAISIFGVGDTITVTVQNPKFGAPVSFSVTTYDTPETAPDGPGIYVGGNLENMSGQLMSHLPPELEGRQLGAQWLDDETSRFVFAGLEEDVLEVTSTGEFTFGFPAGPIGPGFGELSLNAFVSNVSRAVGTSPLDKDRITVLEDGVFGSPGTPDVPATGAQLIGSHPYDTSGGSIAVMINGTPVLIPQGADDAGVIDAIYAAQGTGALIHPSINGGVLTLTSIVEGSTSEVVVQGAGANTLGFGPDSTFIPGTDPIPGTPATGALPRLDVVEKILAGGDPVLGQPAQRNVVYGSNPVHYDAGFDLAVDINGHTIMIADGSSAEDAATAVNMSAGDTGGVMALVRFDGADSYIDLVQQQGYPISIDTGGGAIGHYDGFYDNGDTGSPSFPPTPLQQQVHDLNALVMSLLQRIETLEAGQ